MSFCSSGETISVSNYSVKYTGPSCLPGGDPFPETSGIVSDSALQGQLNTLFSNIVGSNTPISNQNATSFATASDSLRILIQNEFCYYYNRYKFALNKLQVI